MSPVADDEVAVPCACAEMLDAVISPLKSDSDVTSAAAVAVACDPVSADTLAFADPAVTRPL